MNDGTTDIVDQSDRGDREVRWERVKLLFHAALEEAPQRRKSFLRETCAGDQALLIEVERLLANDSLAGSFMEEPAAGEASRALLHERSRAAEGRPVGPYRLLREIGHGGMWKMCSKTFRCASRTAK